MSTAPKISLADEQKELATRYVLGELTVEEIASFEALYSADAGFRRAYNDWAADLDAQVAQEPATGTSASSNSTKGWFRSELLAQALGKLGLVPAVVGAFVAALLVVLVTNMELLTQDLPAPLLTAELRTQAAETLATIAYRQDQAAVTVGPAGVLSAPDRVWELWLLTGTSVPRSLGTFDDQAGQFVLDLSAFDTMIADGVQIEITEEPIGGAGAAGPTGDVVARGVLNAT